MLHITGDGDTLRFEVHAKPRARASAVVGERDGKLLVSLAAPPADGAANERLLALLAETLAVPARRVHLVRGHSSRTKLVAVEGVTRDELLRRLGLPP